MSVLVDDPGFTPRTTEFGVVRVMIADPDDVRAGRIREHLEEQGLIFKSERVSTGDEACERLERWRPHAVIAAAEIPGQAPWETLQHATREGVTVPFVVVTAATVDRQTRGRFIAAGAVDCVGADLTGLSAAVEEAFQIDRNRRRWAGRSDAHHDDDENPYERIVRTLPLPLLIIQDERIAFANGAAAAVFAVDNPGVLLARRPERYLPESERSRLTAYMRARVNGRSDVPAVYPTVLTRADGQQFPARLYVTMVMYRRRAAEAVAVIDFSSSGPEAAAGDGEDAAKLRQLKARVRQAGHDFANLLMLISSHASFVEEDLEEGAPGHSDIAAVLSAARRAAVLNRDLHALARQ